MNNYSSYQVGDWLHNPAFQRWAYHRERDEFWQEVLKSNPGQRTNMEQAKEILLAIRGELDVLPEAEVKSRVSEIMRAVPDEPLHALPWWRSNWLKVAAMLLLTLGIVVALFREQKSLKNLQTFVAGLREPTTPSAIEVYNQSNAFQLVNLPDGSSVVLKKHARITYPAVFATNQREVTLRGEAFFEVVKNPEQPFLVYAGSMVTKVKGTSFSIKANDEDDDVELVVKTGVVEVSPLDGQADVSTHRKLILKPNEQVTFNRKSLNMVTKTVQKPVLLNLPAESQNFEFKRTPLAKVFETLEKTYGIRIQYDQTAIAHCTLTARLGDEPVHEKLDLICTVVNAQYEMQGGTVAVSSEGCE